MAISQTKMKVIDLKPKIEKKRRKVVDGDYGFINKKRMK